MAASGSGFRVLFCGRNDQSWRGQRFAILVNKENEKGVASLDFRNGNRIVYS
jgi:hypothetical protein